MDLDFNAETKELNFHESDHESESVRSKTSNRIHYEAQVQVIKAQCGSLEEIRGKLGLTQRKMAQLLMVDPSAWTRWTKKGSIETAPPHIYRALQWYMTLLEKIPGLTPQYFVGRDTLKISDQIEPRLKSLEEQNTELLKIREDLESKVQKLETQIQANRVGFFMLVLALLILGGVFLFRMMR
jgi:transcriptional regulator with XRE-family HTH domain